MFVPLNSLISMYTLVCPCPYPLILITHHSVWPATLIASVVLHVGNPLQLPELGVYPAGNVIKVNFGHGGTSAAAAGEETMRIRKSNPDRRKAFRARHNCDTPGPRTKARYWSCKKW